MSDSYEEEKERTGTKSSDLKYYDSSNTMQRIDDMREAAKRIRNTHPKRPPEGKGPSGHLDTQLFKDRDIVGKYMRKHPDVSE